MDLDTTTDTDYSVNFVEHNKRPASHSPPSSMPLLKRRRVNAEAVDGSAFVHFGQASIVTSCDQSPVENETAMSCLPHVLPALSKTTQVIAVLRHAARQGAHWIDEAGGEFSTLDNKLPPHGGMFFRMMHHGGTALEVTVPKQSLWQMLATALAIGMKTPHVPKCVSNAVNVLGCLMLTKLFGNSRTTHPSLHLTVTGNLRCAAVAVTRSDPVGHKCQSETAPEPLDVGTVHPAFAQMMLNVLFILLHNLRPAKCGPDAGCLAANPLLRRDVPLQGLPSYWKKDRRASAGIRVSLSYLP